MDRVPAEWLRGVARAQRQIVPWREHEIAEQLRRVAAQIRAYGGVEWATRPCSHCGTVTTVDVLRDATPDAQPGHSDPDRCDLVCPDCWEAVCDAEDAADAEAGVGPW